VVARCAQSSAQSSNTVLWQHPRDDNPHDIARTITLQNLSEVPTAIDQIRAAIPKQWVPRRAIPTLARFGLVPVQTFRMAWSGAGGPASDHGRCVPRGAKRVCLARASHRAERRTSAAADPPSYSHGLTEQCRSGCCALIGRNGASVTMAIRRDRGDRACPSRDDDRDRDNGVVQRSRTSGPARIHWLAARGVSGRNSGPSSAGASRHVEVDGYGVPPSGAGLIRTGLCQHHRGGGSPAMLIRPQTPGWCTLIETFASGVATPTARRPMARAMSLLHGLLLLRGHPVTRDDAPGDDTRSSPSRPLTALTALTTVHRSGLLGGGATPLRAKPHTRLSPSSWGSQPDPIRLFNLITKRSTRST